MAFVLGAAEAGELLAASYEATLPFARGIAASDFAGGIAGGALGALGLGGILYGAIREDGSAHSDIQPPSAAIPVPRPAPVPSSGGGGGGDRLYRMPVRRRPMRSFRRRVRRRTGARTYRKKRPQNMRIGGFLGIEKKFVDYQVDQAVVGAVAGSEADPTSNVNCLNASATGDGETNRDGKSVRLLSVEVKGTILFAGLDQATPATLPTVRLLLVQDKQTNGAQLNAEDVLNDPSDADLDVTAFENLQYSKRFKIWRDFHINMPAASSTWDGDSALSGGAIIPFRMYASLNFMACNFTSTTAVIANIMDNSFHVIAIGSAGITATIRYGSRCRFIG